MAALLLCITLLCAVVFRANLRVAPARNDEAQAPAGTAEEPGEWLAPAVDSRVAARVDALPLGHIVDPPFLAGSIEGVVVEPDGSRAADAVVEVLLLQATDSILGASRPLSEPAIATCTTGQEGRFAVGVSSVGEYALRVTPAREEYAIELRLPCLTGEFSRIQLVRAGTILGTIQTRNPDISTGHVALRRRNAATDWVCVATSAIEHGRYGFQRLGSGDYALIAYAGGICSATARTSIAFGESRQIDLLFASEPRLRGKVVDDATGMGLARAEVSAVAEFGEWTSCDIAGEFELSGPALVHGRRAVTARSPGYAPVTVALPEGLEAALQLKPLEIRLRAGRRADGRVVDGVTGEPLPGVSVMAFSRVGPRAGDVDVHRTSTDALGAIELRDLRTDRQYVAILQKPGFATNVCFPESIDESRLGFGDLALHRGGSIRGRVIDAESRAIAEVQIDLQLGGGSEPVGSVETAAWEAVRRGWRRRTGEAGTFVLSDLPEGVYQVEASIVGEGRTSRVSQPAVVVPQVESSATFVFRPGLDLRGTLLHADGSPASGAYILLRLENLAQDIVATTRSDRAGKFHLHDLSPGTYVLGVTPEATDRSSAGCVFSGVTPGGGELSLRLPAASTVWGVVLDETGLPVAAALVVARDGHLFLDQTTSDADGGFRLVVAADRLVDVVARPTMSTADDPPRRVPVHDREAVLVGVAPDSGGLVLQVAPKH